ncbi:MAG TPA: PEGA domain-containing protein, partial [Vicinamibacterales bacterium]
SPKAAAASSAPVAHQPGVSLTLGRRLTSTLGRLVDAIRRPTARWAVPGLVVVVALQTVVIAALSARASARRGAAPAATTRVVDSPQLGTEVVVDGKPAGVTPLRLNVASSTKSIRIEPAATGVPSTVPGPAAGSATVATAVDVTSDPAGARVTIDGKPSGVTPLTLPVAPGAHEVVISSGSSSMSRTVNVGAGTTAAVMAALPAPGSGAGWVTLASPVELQVLEGGLVIGTTTAARLMLPAGRHDLIVSSAALGFQAPVHVDVQAGKTGITTVSVPNGSVSINALPWATVSLDGRDLGTTPIANVDVPLGTHDVVLRHPQLGDRRQSILVTAKGPVRLVVDFNKR